MLSHTGAGSQTLSENCFPPRSQLAQATTSSIQLISLPGTIGAKNVRPTRFSHARTLSIISGNRLAHMRMSALEAFTHGAQPTRENPSEYNGLIFCPRPRHKSKHCCFVQ